MPCAVPTPFALAGIGIATGLFSALFGVGGGVLVVPLLVLLLGSDSREATGTSLAAIGLTALFGTLAFATLGEVVWRDAALVGVPALAGITLGTWVQQRLPSRALQPLLAALLLALAVRLLL